MRIFYVQLFLTELIRFSITFIPRIEQNNDFPRLLQWMSGVFRKNDFNLVPSNFHQKAVAMVDITKV